MAAKRLREALLLAGCAAFSLTACGDDESNNDVGAGDGGVQFALSSTGVACCEEQCTAEHGHGRGGECTGTGCIAGHSDTVGGSCFGDNCQAGHGYVLGGSCLGTGCTGGRGSKAGGNCYGDGCTAGDSLGIGGDCYAPSKNCTPGKGTKSNGQAYDLEAGAPIFCCHIETGQPVTDHSAYHETTCDARVSLIRAFCEGITVFCPTETFPFWGPKGKPAGV